MINRAIILGSLIAMSMRKTGLRSGTLKSMRRKLLALTRISLKLKVQWIMIRRYRFEFRAISV